MKIVLAILLVVAGIVLLPILGGIVAMLWHFLPPIFLAVGIIVIPILLIGILIGKFIN